MTFRRMYVDFRLTFSASLFLVMLGASTPQALAQEEDHDVAFEWIEAQLKGIRTDFARPPLSTTSQNPASPHHRTTDGAKNPAQPPNPMERTAEYAKDVACSLCDPPPACNSIATTSEANVLPSESAPCPARSPFRIFVA